jgi:hypothetical protein
MADGIEFRNFTKSAMLSLLWQPIPTPGTLVSQGSQILVHSDFCGATGMTGLL